MVSKHFFTVTFQEKYVIQYVMHELSCKHIWYGSMAHITYLVYRDERWPLTPLATCWTDQSWLGDGSHCVKDWSILPWQRVASRLMCWRWPRLYKQVIYDVYAELCNLVIASYTICIGELWLLGTDKSGIKTYLAICWWNPRVVCVLL